MTGTKTDKKMLLFQKKSIEQNDDLDEEGMILTKISSLEKPKRKLSKKARFIPARLPTPPLKRLII